MERQLSTTEKTKELAEQLAAYLKPGDVLALYGDLGSGKTTFSGYLTKSLGFIDRVQSPTFIILRIYKNTENPKVKEIYHFDLYRITTSEELIDIGFKDMISSKDNIIIIEWPEIAEEFLPSNTIRIKFEHVDENTRKVNIDGVETFN